MMGSGERAGLSVVCGLMLARLALLGTDLVHRMDIWCVVAQVLVVAARVGLV